MIIFTSTRSTNGICTPVNISRMTRGCKFIVYYYNFCIVSYSLNMNNKLSKSTKRRRVLQEIDEILPSFDTVTDELEEEQLMKFNTPDPVDKDSELHSFIFDLWPM